MGSVVNSFVRLLISAFLVVQVFGSYGSAPTNDVYNFLSVLNGYYDNKEQASQPNSPNDLIEIIWMPLDVPALRPALSMFVAETANGKVVRYFLGALGADSDGTATIFFFNVTKPSFYENRLLTITASEVTSLELGDLAPIENCIVDFYSGELQLSIKARQQCHDTGAPRYIVVLSCYGYTAYVPPGSPETSTAELYDHKRRERYQVPGLPADFKPLCPS